MAEELEDFYARCTKIKADFAKLIGSRDYQDRARRVALRVEYREAYRALQDQCNDLKIGLMAGFPWEHEEGDIAEQSRE